MCIKIYAAFHAKIKKNASLCYTSLLRVRNQNINITLSNQQIIITQLVQLFFLSWEVYFLLLFLPFLFFFYSTPGKWGLPAWSGVAFFTCLIHLSWLWITTSFCCSSFFNLFKEPQSSGVLLKHICKKYVYSHCIVYLLVGADHCLLLFSHIPGIYVLNLEGRWQAI